MSSSPRSAALHEAAIGWLEADAAVADLLGADGEIVPATIAAEALDDHDPLLAVGSEATTSSRDNEMEAKTFQVRVAVAGSKALVTTGGGTHRLTRLLNAAEDVLTDNRGQWHAQGVSVEESVAWNDELARHIGAAEMAYWRQD